MTDVSSCPFCECRFQARWELRLHLDSDHPGRIQEKDRTAEGVVVEESDPLEPPPI